MKTITVVLMSLLMMAATSIAGPGGKRKGGCDGPEGRHFQCGNKPGHGGPRIEHLLKNAEEIGLTDDQVDKLSDMAVKFRLGQVDRKAAMEKAQIELKALKHDDKSSKKEVYAAIDELASRRAELHKAKYAHRKDIHGLLSEDQQQKMKQFRKERGACKEGRDENSRHRGGLQGHSW